MARFNVDPKTMLERLTQLMLRWGLIDDGYYGKIIISIDKGLAVSIKREQNIK